MTYRLFSPNSRRQIQEGKYRNFSSKGKCESVASLIEEMIKFILSNGVSFKLILRQIASKIIHTLQNYDDPKNLQPFC